MKRAVVALAWLTVVGIGCGSCADRSGPSEDTTPNAHTVIATDGAGTRIHLGAAEIVRAGIASAAVETADAPAERAAFGRVLDPLPLVELRRARDAVHVAAGVAGTELERVTHLLRDDHNAAVRDVEAARAARDKAAADLDVASARLAIAWGPAADLGDDVLAALVAGRAALVRVDLPAGIARVPPPAAVTIVTETERRDARVLGRAPTTDPLVQGESWLALAEHDPPRPGALLAVTVTRPPDPTHTLAVPATALVWVDARPAVYVERAAREFERRAVTLGARRGRQWVVTAGLAPDERVVVAGAALLVSAELARAEPGED